MSEFETNIGIIEPPSSMQLEQEILTMVIKDDRLIRDMADSVKPTDFFELRHRKFYESMLYLHHANIKIGYQTIIDTLETKGIDKSSETVAYLIELGSVYIERGTIEEKVDLLIDLSRKRDLYNLYKKRLTHPMNGIGSANMVKEIEHTIDGMGITSNLELDNFSAYIDEWVVQLEDTTSTVQKYKTGYKLLDEMVLLEDSNLMLVSARPSVGKSAYALNFAKNFCKQGKHTLFVSLEMSPKEIMNRLVANVSHTEAKKIKRKEGITSNEWARIMKAKEEIKSWKLNTYAKGSMYVEQLLGLCRHLKKKGELDVLIVDYLQLLDSHAHAKNRVQQVSFISRKLKQIAMELEIPVIALSQLSRASIDQTGKPRKPQLSDLRESGSLEQDANVVIMLHTDDIEQKFQDKRYIQVYIRKNRDGRLGEIYYTYYGDYVEFIETEWINGVSTIVEQDEIVKEEDKGFFDGIGDLV